MIESLKPIFRRGLVAVVGGGVLMSCGINGEPVPERSCAAFTAEGKSFAPSRYPVGAVAMKFSEFPSAFSVAINSTDTDGTINKVDGHFTVTFKEKLPREFTGQSLDGELPNKDVVIQLTTPETGTFGVTSGCLSPTEVNEYDTRVSVVSLPTAS